ncbi:MAG: polysaccharide deacetylase family protein [Anaerolineaceae bacterium]|nr:polysaccharide deacetylase family protein [Anaerolineaceae bacterium]
MNPGVLLKKIFFLAFAVFFCLACPHHAAMAESASREHAKKPLFCATPSSIMLHSRDGVYGMRWLANAIEKNGLQTMTYRQVSQLWQGGHCPPENAILVSLDDLGSSWLSREFKNMISVFTDKGYVLTLAVVTGGDEKQQNAEIWDYLKALDAQGLEIASHSAWHSLLESRKDKSIQQEADLSYQLICEHLGRCPVTFVLPFGRGLESERVMRILQKRYTNIVSIPGPFLFYKKPFLFKRIPLVRSEENPSQPKLGAPFFIRIKENGFNPHPAWRLPNQQAQ